MSFDIKFSYDSRLEKPRLEWTANVVEYGVEENNIAEHISDIVQKMLSFQKETNRITEGTNGN